GWDVQFPNAPSGPMGAHSTSWLQARRSAPDSFTRTMPGPVFDAEIGRVDRLKRRARACPWHEAARYELRHIVFADRFHVKREGAQRVDQQSALALAFNDGFLAAVGRIADGDGVAFERRL